MLGCQVTAAVVVPSESLHFELRSWFWRSLSSNAETRTIPNCDAEKGSSWVSSAR